MNEWCVIVETLLDGGKNNERENLLEEENTCSCPNKEMEVDVEIIESNSIPLEAKVFTGEENKVNVDDNAFDNEIQPAAKRGVMIGPTETENGESFEKYTRSPSYNADLQALWR